MNDDYLNNKESQKKELDEFECERIKKKKHEHVDGNINEEFVKKKKIKIDNNSSNFKEEVNCKIREDNLGKRKKNKKKKKKIMNNNMVDLIPNTEEDDASSLPPRKKIKNMKKEDNNIESEEEILYNDDIDGEAHQESDTFENSKTLKKINNKLNEGNVKKNKYINKNQKLNEDNFKIIKKKKKITDANISRSNNFNNKIKHSNNNVNKKKDKSHLKDANKINGNRKTKDIYNNKENIKMTFNVTNRFTVLGCDWDNISSVDIFYLFESYYNFEKRKKKNIDYSKSRAVKKVTIYTSKYGEKKLKYEEEHGPLINFDLLKKKSNKDENALYRKNNLLDYIKDEDENSEHDNSDDEEENEEPVEVHYGNNNDSEELDNQDEDTDNNSLNDMYSDSEDNNDKLKYKSKKVISKRNSYNNEGDISIYRNDEDDENEKIRLYQIQRSRYYFALVECYNKEIVEYLYEELNDMDADFCINYLDLRIIDDNCSLDDYKIKESCDKIPENYEFHYSVSTALKHTHAQSTWEENPKRKKLLSTKFNEEQLRELDLKEYLANSSSDEEDEEDKEDDEIVHKNKNKKYNEKNERYNKESYRKLLLGDLLNDDDLNEEKTLEDLNKSLTQNSNDDIYDSSDNFDETHLYHNEDITNFNKKQMHSKNEHTNTHFNKEDSNDESIEESEYNYFSNDENINKKDYKSKYNEKKKSKNNKEKHDSDDSDKENEVVNVFKNFLTNKDKKEDNRNPWEKYLDKVKEKKKMKKKAYLESLKKTDEEIKKIITKKTNKRKKDSMMKNYGEKNKEKTNDYHVVDSRFADLYKNKDFNLDITNPNYKKTKFNEDVLKKKKSIN
ncbi:small subunit rRNA processing factor, putative [Plasmodium gaboni]|uniref:Small subunit rRNA processing factor, putative n=1 Tax=Plasmodium gaboni TaxID=647221 RepID=A0ABY1UQJ1_9APIC|nr:small subunit rRNA processing factor, putative [Plasmodium gaboni]